MTASFEYSLTFEFDVVSERVRAKGRTREELRNFVRRKKLRRIDDEFADMIIQFMQIVLIERKLGDEAHLLFLIRKEKKDLIEVYSNDIRQLIAIKIFSSADIL